MLLDELMRGNYFLKQKILSTTAVLMVINFSMEYLPIYDPSFKPVAGTLKM